MYAACGRRRRGNRRVTPRETDAEERRRWVALGYVSYSVDPACSEAGDEHR